MNIERLVKGIYTWKPLGKRTAGGPKNRWEDDVNDLKLLKVKTGQSASKIMRVKKDFEEVKTFKE
jgi:hypothetical protein